MKKLLLLFPFLLLLPPIFCQTQVQCDQGQCSGLGAPVGICTPGSKYTQVGGAGNQPLFWQCGGIPPTWVAGSTTDNTKLPLTGGTLTGPLVSPSVNAVFSANGGAGSIAAALASAGASGAVQIPKSTVDASAYANANSIPLLDWRRGVAWRGHVDVFDFGAQCNGTADDTSAFQAALTYAGLLSTGAASGGIQVLIPSGSGFNSSPGSTCNVHELSVTGHVQVTGSGSGVTRIVYNGSGGPGSYLFNEPGPSFGGFRGMTLVGGGRTQALLPQWAIWLSKATSGTSTIDEQFITDDLEIIGTSGDAIHVDNTIAPTNWHIGPHIAFRAIGGYGISFCWVPASQSEGVSLNDFTYDNNPAQMNITGTIPTTWGQGVMRVCAEGQTTQAGTFKIGDGERIEVNVPLNTSVTQNGWTVGQASGMFYFEHQAGAGFDDAVNFDSISVTGVAGSKNMTLPKLTFTVSGGALTGCAVTTAGVGLISNPTSWTFSDTGGSGATVTTTYNSAGQDITACTASGGTGFTVANSTATPVNNNVANGNSPLVLAVADTNTLQANFSNVNVSPAFGGMNYLDGTNPAYSIPGGFTTFSTVPNSTAPQNVFVDTNGAFAIDQGDSTNLPGRSFCRLSGTTWVRMDYVYDSVQGLQLRNYAPAAGTACNAYIPSSSTRFFEAFGANTGGIPGSTWILGNINAGSGSNKDVYSCYGSAPSASTATFCDFAAGGSPQGVITANPGALFRDTTNGNLWFKQTGTQTNTGWTQLSIDSNSGTVTLVAGTATVSSAVVSAASIITLTNCAPAGTQGFLSVGTVTAGTSFVINSSSSTDISKVCWRF